nr:MFS transporter [Synergistaceae bacterium]
MQASNQFALFRSRNFMPLFLTQFLGAFNDNFFKSAMVILITYRLAEASGLDARILVTVAAGVFILPFFLFSASAGQLADKYERSRLIQLIKIAEIVIMSGAAAGFFLESIPLLMIILFLMGAQSTFFGPIKYSILPQHLKEDELIAGNALIETGTFISILTGTIFGGLFVLRSGGIHFVSILVVGIAVAGWWASWFIPKTTPIDPSLKLNKNIVEETLKIIADVKPRHDIFLAILGISWFWLVGATFLSQFPTYAKDVIGANE